MTTNNVSGQITWQEGDDSPLEVLASWRRSLTEEWGISVPDAAPVLHPVAPEEPAHD